MIHSRSGALAGSGILLWTLVLGAMSLDVASTFLGLSLGLVELNPIAAAGIEAVGFAALALLKVPALALGIVGWRRLSDRYRRLNLFGLALPWIGAVAANSLLILRHL